jgi:hypothetical protein
LYQVEQAIRLTNYIDHTNLLPAPWYFTANSLARELQTPIRVCWVYKARLPPLLGLHRVSARIVSSGTSHPTHQLYRSYQSVARSLVFHCQQPSTRAANTNTGVLGVQSATTTVARPPQGVRTDCIKWNKPSDSPTISILPICCPLLGISLPLLGIALTVLSLPSHCTLTIISLCSDCSDCALTELSLCSHCALSVLSLPAHCARTIISLCSDCALTVLGLCSDFALTVL